MQTKQEQVTDAQRTQVYILWAVLIFTALNLLVSETWTVFVDAELGMVYIGFAIYGVIWVMNRI